MPGAGVASALGSSHSSGNVPKQAASFRWPRLGPIFLLSHLLLGRVQRGGRGVLHTQGSCPRLSVNSEAPHVGPDCSPGPCAALKDRVCFMVPTAILSLTLSPSQLPSPLWLSTAVQQPTANQGLGQ